MTGGGANWRTEHINEFDDTIRAVAENLRLGAAGQGGAGLGWAGLRLGLIWLGFGGAPLFWWM